MIDKNCGTQADHQTLDNYFWGLLELEQGGGSNFACDPNILVPFHSQLVFKKPKKKIIFQKFYLLTEGRPKKIPTQFPSDKRFVW